MQRTRGRAFGIQTFTHPPCLRHGDAIDFGLMWLDGTVRARIRCVPTIPVVNHDGMSGTYITTGITTGNGVHDIVAAAAPVVARGR